MILPLLLSPLWFIFLFITWNWNMNPWKQNIGCGHNTLTKLWKWQTQILEQEGGWTNQNAWRINRKVVVPIKMHDRQTEKWHDQSKCFLLSSASWKVKRTVSILNSRDWNTMNRSYISRFTLMIKTLKKTCLYLVSLNS